MHTLNGVKAEPGHTGQVRPYEAGRGQRVGRGRAAQPGRGDRPTGPGEGPHRPGGQIRRRSNISIDSTGNFAEGTTSLSSLDSARHCGEHQNPPAPNAAWFFPVADELSSFGVILMTN